MDLHLREEEKRKTKWKKLNREESLLGK